MALEIERKFLVKDDSYRQKAVSSSHIRQGYICVHNGRTVRIRIRDDKAYLTIKGPSENGGLSRYEWEKQVSLEDGEDLMRLVQEGLIDKRRYLVPSGKHVFEVDEFYGENEGLVVAEVELESENEPFLCPSFIGKEVTGDHRYYNSALSTHPYRSW